MIKNFRHFQFNFQLKPNRKFYLVKLLLLLFKVFRFYLFIYSIMIIKKSARTSLISATQNT